jgi:SPIRAL1-like protein
MTDRSSSRVLAPPGGKTSITFGDCETRRSRAQAPPAVPAAGTGAGAPAAGVKRGTSNNAFASGANPNCGNVMTDRSSSRVLAPPGGKSSFSLGGGYGSDAQPARRSRAQAPPAAKALKEKTNEAQTMAAGAKRGTSNNAFASGANPNCGNVMTDRSSSRVLAPPGGKTTFTLG